MTEITDDLLSRIAVPAPNGVRVFIKVRPGDNRHRPPRLVATGDDRYALEIGVTAVAEDGKANKAVIAALAEALHLPKVRLDIIAGQTSRLKTILIQTDLDHLRRCLTGFIQND